MNIEAPAWFRAIPNLFPKITFGQRLIEKGFQPVSGGYGFNNYQSDQESVLLKKVDYLKHKSTEQTGLKQKADTANTVYKLQPAWFLYENMYNSLMSVSTAVNKKATAMSNLKGIFKDINGVENQQLTHDFEEQFGLKKLITQISKQRDTFGTNIVIKKMGRPDDDYPVFIAVPMSQTQNFFVNKATLQIESFSWNRSDIFQYELIERKDKNGDLGFYAFADPDLSDQFFGSSRLQSAFTTLDSFLRDEQNYQLFLKNASFPGIIAFLSGDNQEGTSTELDSFFRGLRDPDSRFKATTLKNTIDGNGNPTVAFKILEQNIANRYSEGDKDRVDRQVYGALGIPAILMGNSQSTGIGANEYEPAMTMYKRDCLEPHATDIEHIINSFISPEGLRFMQLNKYFEQKEIKVKVGETERPATYKDFSYSIGEIVLEDVNTRVSKGLDLFNAGSILNSELKTKYLGYKPEEVTEEDKFRKIPNGVSIVKEGELKEGTVGAEDSSKDVQDETKEDIGDGQTLDQDTTAPKNETTDPEKTKAFIPTTEIVKQESTKTWNSIKVKSKVKDFLAKQSDFSRVPELFDTAKAKQEEKRLKEALLKQYSRLNLKKLFSTKEKAVTDEEAFKLALINQISNEIPDLNINVEELVSTLLFFAKLGASTSEKEALDQASITATPQQKEQIQNQISDFLDKRTSNLLNGLPAGQKPDPTDIANPYYDGSLNDTSINQLADLVVSLKKENPEADDDLLEKLFLARILLLVGDRAKLIMQGEVERAFNLGIYLAAEELGADTYTWLKTKAKHPSQDHLELVGQTRKAKDFPENPGARFGCQCSWKPNFSRKV